MAHQEDLRRKLAKRYLELARTTEDLREREKFLGYATIYEQLSGQSDGDETSAPREKEQRHKPRRRDG